ncbi:MAG: hypothetical protein U0R17_03685 [Acidimicrobiia bacterium]
MIKRLIFFLLLCIITLTACSNTSTKKNSSTTSAPALISSPIKTIYAVGDIDSFDNNLKAIAEKEIRSNPDSLWLLLGDSGYGNSEQVNQNYKEIIKTIPQNNIRMIYGDHDYGTQDPKDFTESNKLKTGAESLLNAQDNLALGLDDTGKLSKLDSSKKYLWTIIGTNDICVEIPDNFLDNCNTKNNSTFIQNLKAAKNSSACTIAAWHHPIYAVLKNGGADQVNSQKYGTELYEQSISYGVDIVLNADHHQFLATKQINVEGKLAEPNEKSTREFIVGTGGAPVSTDNLIPKLPKNAIDSDLRKIIGVLKIDLYKNKAMLSFISEQKIEYTTSISC